MQLDSFAGAALKQTEDGGVWLQGGFFLSEQIGTRKRRIMGQGNRRLLILNWQAQRLPYNSA